MSFEGPLQTTSVDEKSSIDDLSYEENVHREIQG